MNIIERIDRLQDNNRKQICLHSNKKIVKLLETLFSAVVRAEEL
jgi:hypothetical protein